MQVIEKKELCFWRFGRLAGTSAGDGCFREGRRSMRVECVGSRCAACEGGGGATCGRRSEWMMLRRGRQVLTGTLWARFMAYTSTVVMHCQYPVLCSIHSNDVTSAGDAGIGGTIYSVIPCGGYRGDLRRYSGDLRRQASGATLHSQDWLCHQGDIGKGSSEWCTAYAGREWPSKVQVRRARARVRLQVRRDRTCRFVRGVI